MGTRIVKFCIVLLLLVGLEGRPSLAQKAISARPEGRVSFEYGMLSKGQLPSSSSAHRASHTGPSPDGPCQCYGQYDTGLAYGCTTGTCTDVTNGLSQVLNQYVTCSPGHPCQVNYIHGSCYYDSYGNICVNGYKTWGCYFCD